MNKTYKTHFQLILEDEYLKKEFEKFLDFKCFKDGIGPNHNKPLIDKENGKYTDQVACIFDYLNEDVKRCINGQFCGYGKSYIDSFITICLIEFFINHDLRKRNGDKPLIIVKTAPLTSLSNGNQLEKDIQYIFPLMKNNFANIKLINNCSGASATNMSANDENVIFEKIIEDGKYSKDERLKLKRMFSNCIEKIPNINEEELYDYDVVIIYTCDKSFGKINKFSDNFIDLASFDEAHVHFINGGKNKNIEEENIFNSLVKFINKNPNCICRFFTATPIYLNGSEKSTWNRPLFGKEKIYLTYSWAIEIKRALPIHAWIYSNFLKEKNVSFEEFNRMNDENKVKHIAKVSTLCNQKFHDINDTEKYSRSLIKTEGKYFKNLYKMFQKFKKFKSNGKKFDSDDVKNFFKDDIYYQYLVDRGIIIASTSSDGVIILTNDFDKNIEFNNVPELVNFLKDKKNVDEYTNHNMLIFNIRQLSTGHDINIFNNAIILCKCEADDFQQCIFRSGRLNGIKKKNIVFLVDSVIDNETLQYYVEILDRLATKIGAFDGHITAEFKGDGIEVINKNEAWIYLKNIKLSLLEKQYKCIDSNKLINAKTSRDKFYNEWRIKNIENMKLDSQYRFKDQNLYEDFKDKICMQNYNEINEKLINDRVYKDN